MLAAGLNTGLPAVAAFVRRGRGGKVAMEMRQEMIAAGCVRRVLNVDGGRDTHRQHISTSRAVKERTSKWRKSQHKSRSDSRANVMYRRTKRCPKHRNKAAIAS